jgi:hypothetical protein
MLAKIEDANLCTPSTGSEGPPVIPATNRKSIGKFRIQYLAYAIALTLFALIGTVEADDYELVMLEPPGFEIVDSTAMSISELGQVAGFFEELNGTFRGFTYDSASESYWVTESNFALVDLNNFGQIVGEDWSSRTKIWSTKAARDIGFQAYFWNSQGDQPRPLPPLPGEEITSANGINDQGLIIGFSADENFASLPLPYVITPVVWQATPTGVSVPIPLPLPVGHFIGRAEGISQPNGNGVSYIVGASGNLANGNPEIAVRWKVKVKPNGTLVLLEGPVELTTAGESGVGNAGRATNINAFSVGEKEADAFKRSKNGTMRALKTLKISGQQSNFSNAWGVNEFKDVVGEVSHDIGPIRKKWNGTHAVLWAGGKTIVNLNDVVSLPADTGLKAAHDINNAGEIVVEINTRPRRYQNRRHAGLLIPIQ